MSHGRPRLWLPIITNIGKLPSLPNYGICLYRWGKPHAHLRTFCSTRICLTMSSFLVDLLLETQIITMRNPHFLFSISVSGTIRLFVLWLGAFQSHIVQHRRDIP